METPEEILKDVKAVVASLPKEHRDRVETWAVVIRKMGQNDDAFLMAMALVGAEEGVTQ